MNKQPLMALTTGQMESSGIVARLTQNDVIEVIAQERHTAILKEIEETNNGIQHVRETISQFKEKEKQLFIQELVQQGILSNKQVPGLIVGQLHIVGATLPPPEYAAYGRLNFLHGRDRAYVSLASLSENAGYHEKDFLGIRLELYGHKEHTTERKTFRVSYSASEKTEFYKEVHLPKAFVKKYNQAVQQYCGQVKSVYERYKDLNLDLDTIIRQTKSQFNKELLKSQAPELWKKLEELFGITF